jgi:hypothetical protein
MPALSERYVSEDLFPSSSITDRSNAIAAPLKAFRNIIIGNPDKQGRIQDITDILENVRSPLLTNSKQYRAIDQMVLGLLDGRNEMDKYLSQIEELYPSAFKEMFTGSRLSRHLINHKEIRTQLTELATSLVQSSSDTFNLALARHFHYTDKYYRSRNAKSTQAINSSLEVTKYLSMIILKELKFQLITQPFTIPLREFR